jgi:hypothetical protein
MVLGTVRARLARGQRRTNVHLAFCPPFARIPQVDFRRVDGPPARVTLGRLYAYGARLEVKLDEAAGGPVGVGIVYRASSGQ